MASIRTFSTHLATNLKRSKRGSISISLHRVRSHSSSGASSKKRLGHAAEPRAGTPRHHLRVSRLGHNRSMQVEPHQCPRVHIALWPNSRLALSRKQHSGLAQRGRRVSARHPGSVGLRLASPLRFGNSERGLVSVLFRDRRAGRSARSRANGEIVFSRDGSIACKAEYDGRTHETFRVRALPLLLGHRCGTIYQHAART